MCARTGVPGYASLEALGVANVRWRSGALGTVSVTMLEHRKNFEGTVTLVGQHGTVRVGGVAVNEIQHWDFAESAPEDAQVRDASYRTTSAYGHGRPLYYENAIAALRGDAPAEPDGREGLRSLELLVAMYKSARDGIRVSLPLEL